VSRFNGIRNVEKCAYITESNYGRSRDAPSKKGAPSERTERCERLTKGRSKGHIIAKWTRASFLFFMAELPLFRYSRSSVGLTKEPPTQWRQEMDFLLPLNYYAK